MTNKRLQFLGVVFMFATAVGGCATTAPTSTTQDRTTDFRRIESLPFGTSPEVVKQKFGEPSEAVNAEDAVSWIFRDTSHPWQRFVFVFDSKGLKEKIFYPAVDDSIRTVSELRKHYGGAKFYLPQESFCGTHFVSNRGRMYDLSSGMVAQSLNGTDLDSVGWSLDLMPQNRKTASLPDGCSEKN